MVGGRDHRVVHRSTASGIDFVQRFLELQKIVGEVLVEILLVVEVDHEDFIFRITGTHQVKGGLIYFGALFPHRAGIIDHNSHGDGDINVMEGDDVLRLAVFVDGESVLVEVGDDSLAIVNHRRVQHDFVHVFLEDEDTLIVDLILIILLLVGSCGLVGRGRGRFRRLLGRALRSGSQRPDEEEKEAEKPRGPIRQERNIQSSHTP